MGGSSEMLRFIREAHGESNEDVEATAEQAEKAKKQKITVLYSLLNNEQFQEDKIKKFFEKHGYTMTDKDIEKLKALHSTTDAIFECSATKY